MASAVMRRERFTSMPLLAKILLMHPRMLLAFLAMMVHSWIVVSCLSTRTTRSYASCSPAGQPLAYTGAWSYSFPSAGLCFSLVELHKVPLSPALQSVEADFSGSTIIWCISHSSQFYVISELADRALCSIVHINNEEFKQHWPSGISLVTHLQLGFVPLITIP